MRLDRRYVGSVVAVSSALLVWLALVVAMLWSTLSATERGALPPLSADRVAIVTATNDFVTTPIASAFGVADLIATRLERDAGGTITGRIAGIPSFRDGKVVRVEQWLAGDGSGWADFERITVYSDSWNDLPLLERATDPVAVSPSAELAAIAAERRWPVLKLFA